MTYDELVKQALAIDVSSVAKNSNGNLMLLQSVIPGKGVEIGNYTVDVADSTDSYFFAVLIDQSKRGATPLKELLKGDHDAVIVRINTTNITFYNKFIKTIVDAV